MVLVVVSPVEMRILLKIYFNHSTALPSVYDEKVKAPKSVDGNSEMVSEILPAPEIFKGKGGEGLRRIVDLLLPRTEGVGRD